MDNFLAPELASLDLAALMRAALEEAELAGQAGELPIGAVIVVDGQIIARGHARHQELHSQVRHAELNAILSGGSILWTDYRRAILFTSVEPCPMCLGAAVMADIPHIIYAIPDKVVQSDLTVENNPYVRRHIRSYYGGVLEQEAAEMFARYDPAALQYIQTGRYAQASIEARK